MSLVIHGRPVSIRRTEAAATFHVYSVGVRMCSKTVTWEATLYGTNDISLSVDSFDVTPVLSTMQSISHAPYAVGDRILDIPTDGGAERLLISIAEALTMDFVSHQETLLNEVTVDSMRFLIDMLKDIPNAALLVEASDGHDIVVEFPLLDGSRVQDKRLEYLLDVLESSPIIVCISLSCKPGGVVTTNPSISFPAAMPCTRGIDVPRWEYESLTVFEYITKLENSVLANWETRYVFVQQLLLLGAVTEFDAVDFSYVSFILRVKQKNMFSMCSIEVKLGSSFPREPPMVSFFDVKTSLCTIVESSELSQSEYFNSSWPAERIADGTFLFCWEKLLHMSFGDA